MTTTATRRPATEADFTPGAIVYKGNGKCAYRVVCTCIQRDQNGEPNGQLLVSILKATSKDRSGNAWHYPSTLTVEV